MLTLQLRRGENDCLHNGSYGEYYRLPNGKGLKVLSVPGEARMDNLLESGRWQEAVIEAENLKKAERSKVVPKCYGVVAVRMGKLYYPGILMEHIRGIMLSDIADDVYAQISDQAYPLLREKLKKLKMVHMDLHDENIIVQEARDGSFKFFAIDFGPNSIRSI